MCLIRWPRRGIVLLLLYVVNLGFAWTYNVGDAYIFFLPSHYVLALCAGAGVAAIVAFLARVSRRSIATAAGVICLVYPAWRGYDTFPAIDRSWDNRAVRLLDEFTTGPAAIYGVDTNWQIQNAYEYFMRQHKPHVPWFTTEELQWLHQGNDAARFEAFVAANAEAGRKVVRRTRGTQQAQLHRQPKQDSLRVPRLARGAHGVRSSGHALHPCRVAGRPRVPP